MVDDEILHAAGEVETESFASAEEGAQGASMVVASYNIRYAVGSFLITGSLFRRLRMGRPARRPRLVQGHVEKAARAFSDGRLLPRVDVLCLQEADKESLRAGGHHVARELARGLRMHYAHAAFNLPRDEEPEPRQWYLDFEERIAPSETGDTGIAILSRLPLMEVERLDLPWSECAWRPRLALAATVALSAQQVRLFNLHIDPHATTDEQLEQHRAVLKRADEWSGAVAILGDFNTLTRAACEKVRAFVEAHGYTTPMPTGVATWRAGLIRLHPDWIFVRGLNVKRWGVARPLNVSDHWPVWAEIEVESKASA